MGNRRYERPEVKQISRAWVRENCGNITDRDIGLLKTLHNHNRRILRRDQIERLYPHFASTDRLNKRLNVLYKLHVIDKCYPQVAVGKGSSKQHVCLDRAGAILLDISNHTKVISPNKELPLGWRHKVTINEYECQIREVVESVGARLLMYEAELPYTYNDSKIIPDIFFLIKHRGKGFLFFVEVDMGTEDVPYIKKKIDSYVDFYLSKSWARSKWASLFKTPTFPRVLFFTENGREKRKASLQDYTRESSIRFHFGFHDSFKDDLKSLILK